MPLRIHQFVPSFVLGLPTNISWICRDIITFRFARSSLVEAALSVGALVTRDRVAAVGFAENARQLLKEIFDVPSEEAASAFLCLAYFNTYSGEALRADL